jgi:predicted glycoside hydrolase/deacetylase ChbG (UPF0249 family)
VQGKAILPHSEIPQLVDREGNFQDSPVAAGLKYYFSGAAREQLAKELAAQFQRFHSTGLKLSHVDSHLHLHIHPVIFRAVLELAERYEIRRMRVPYDDFWLAVRFQRKNLLKLAGIALIFWALTRRMKKHLLDRGFSFPERVYGHFYSSRMTLEYVLFVVDHLSAKTNEIYFHPAAFEEGCASNGLQHRSAMELGVLASSELRKRLRDPDIKLTDYGGLAGAL